jgi:fructose/tagatose bisphosphate aldolase
MPADAGAAPGQYTQRVRRLTDLAHQHGVAVEAEIERTPGNDDAVDTPEAATAFVKATGVDLLAVEVGNEEIKLQGRAPLDVVRLKEIQRAVKIPLVLHGGTGIEDASLRQAIRLGVRKVNYGTYMKQSVLTSLRRALALNNPNPHALLGDGSGTDLVVIVRSVVREAVLERIELLGCCGRA